MSLTNPNTFDKAWGILKMKPVYIGLGLLVLLGAVLFTIKKVSDWNFSRGVKHDKQAIANQVAEIANTQAEIANLSVKKAEQVANVAKDTQALLDAANASQQARNATNGALSNLAAAVNANRSVDVSAIDIQRKLDELNQ